VKIIRAFTLMVEAWCWLFKDIRAQFGDDGQLGQYKFLDATPGGDLIVLKRVG
jgi:hypothetical protein